MIYSYARVSTTMQADNGFGLSTQSENIAAYAAANNLTIADSFIDAGVSGTQADRPALSELLAMLGKGDKIIVANTSRLWRSDTVKVLIRHELQKAGADIIAVEQPGYSIYCNDPNDFLFNGILELLDQYDRMQITRKLAAGRRTRAKSGQKACGAAPYGYKWDNKKIVIDYNNHLVVREIFAEYAKVESFQKVADYCEMKGYRTATGGLFSRQAISNILHNDFYIGIVTHAGRKSQGEHEAIIDRELWEAVQESL